MKKLNVLLAKTDYLASQYQAMVKDFGRFFSKSQGAFQGELKTYNTREGVVDEPNRRSNTLIQTTVAEKFEWFTDNCKDYIDAQFALEATNASGDARALLRVDGESWGDFSSLELLRLKSFIENSDLRSMLEGIPVRSDAINWTKSENAAYAARDVYETVQLSGVAKTTVKTNYILDDPNIGKLKDAGSYTPQLGVRSEILELGDYTHQNFNGMFSQRQKAEILKRRSSLLSAIIQALKECNEVEAITSGLTSDKIFGYLLK